MAHRHVLAGGTCGRKARAWQADLKVRVMLEYNALQSSLIVEVTVILTCQTNDVSLEFQVGVSSHKATANGVHHCTFTARAASYSASQV